MLLHSLKKHVAPRRRNMMGKSITPIVRRHYCDWQRMLHQRIIYCDRLYRACASMEIYNFLRKDANCTSYIVHEQALCLNRWWWHQETMELRVRETSSQEIFRWQLIDDYCKTENARHNKRALRASPLHLNINTHDVPNEESAILRIGEIGLR